jgi:hypothetical protein
VAFIRILSRVEIKFDRAADNRVHIVFGSPVAFMVQGIRGACGRSYVSVAKRTPEVAVRHLIPAISAMNIGGKVFHHQKKQNPANAGFVVTEVNLTLSFGG